MHIFVVGLALPATEFHWRQVPPRIRPGTSAARVRGRTFCGFKKEFCALCGQPKGLLGPKLADGNCLCVKCLDSGNEAVHASGVKDFPRRSYREMTLDDYKGDQAFLAESAKKLAEFEPTITYFDLVHIDEDSSELVLVRASDLESLKKEPEKAGVAVHSLHDIAFCRIIYQMEKVKEGLLNDHVIADIILLVAFDEPLTKLYAVKLKSKAKLHIDGIIKKTVVLDEESTKLLNYLDRYFQAHIEDDGREGRYWEAVACARQENYLESDDVTEILKVFYLGDKAKIKEIVPF